MTNVSLTAKQVLFSSSKGWSVERTVEKCVKYLHGWGVFLFFHLRRQSEQPLEYDWKWDEVTDWSNFLPHGCWCDDSSMTEPMSQWFFSSSVAEQEVIQRSQQQLLTPLQRANLSLLLSSRLKDLLNTTPFFFCFCLEWKNKYRLYGTLPKYPEPAVCCCWRWHLPTCSSALHIAHDWCDEILQTTNTCSKYWM